MSLLIPKLFHWIWLGDNPLPEQHLRWREGWLRAHPDWEYRLWTDVRLPNLRSVAEFRRAETPAQKADIVRYEVVGSYGGVYLDTDMECLDNIEPLLDGIGAFAGWLEPEEIGIGMFGAVPGHPWMAEVVSALPEAMRRGFDILWQTGPRFFTQVTKKHADVVVLPKEILYADPGDVAGAVSVIGHRRSYAVHHAAMSWASHNAAATWAKLRHIAEQELDPRIPPGEVFIRVDDDIGIKAFSHRPSVSFVERDGHYVGRPADDDTAIAELQRMQQEGARFIAFIGPASWWLDYYVGLRNYLATCALCVTDNERLVLFRLRSTEGSGSSSVPPPSMR